MATITLTSGTTLNLTINELKELGLIEGLAAETAQSNSEPAVKTAKEAPKKASTRKEQKPFERAKITRDEWQERKHRFYGRVTRSVRTACTTADKRFREVGLLAGFYAPKGKDESGEKRRDWVWAYSYEPMTDEQRKALAEALPHGWQWHEGRKQFYRDFGSDVYGQNK